MTEREWDRRLRIRTIGREDEPNANYASYEPTPYPVLERLARSGYVRRKQRLLDYGCGKGRVAFYMASEVGCRVTGIDQSRKLIELAVQNRKACRAGDRTKFMCCLAEQYEIADENAFFFFNPFSLKVFEAVLRHIKASWYAEPRELMLFFYYPSDEYMQCLADTPEVRQLDIIDCRELFDADNPRECIAVFAFPEG